MSYSTEKKTCAGCGFLCAFHRHKQEVVPIADSMRTEWTTSMDRNNSLAYFEDVPRCFVSAMPLGKEFKESQKQTDWAKGLEVITRERECPRFTPYVPGRPPQWHQDMVDMLELHKLQDSQREKERGWQDAQKTRDELREDEREKREDKRRERELAFQKELKEAELAFQEKQKRADDAFKEKLDRRSRWWTVLITLLSVVLAGVFTLLVQILKEPAAVQPPVAPVINNIMPVPPAMEKAKDKS